MNKKQYTSILGCALIAGLVGGLALNLLFFFGGYPGKSFMLFDNKATHHGAFGYFKGSFPALYFRDKDGNVPLELSLINGIPNISVNGKDGLRFFMRLKDDLPVIVLMDKNEKPRLLLGIREDQPIICLFDSDGKTIWATPASPCGEISDRLILRHKHKERR